MSSRLGGEFCLVCGPSHRCSATACASPAFVPERCWRKFQKTSLGCVAHGVESRLEGKWENTTEAEVWDELLHRNLVVHERAEDIQLAMEPVKVSDRHTLLHIQLEGVIDDLLFQEEHTMRARMANGVCLTCTGERAITSKPPFNSVQVHAV